MRKIYFEGVVVGSYRAQNIMKVVADLGCEFCYLPDSYMRFNVPNNIVWKIIFKVIAILRFLFLMPMRIFLIMKCDTFFVLPMSFSWNTMFFLFIAHLMRKNIIVDYYIGAYDTFVKDRKTYNEKSFKAKRLLLIDQMLMRMAGKLIFLNLAEKNYYSSLVEMSDLVSNKYVVIPLCVDQKQVITRNIKDELIVCWWGTYIPLHGVDKIIKSMIYLKDKKIKLVLLGNSDKEAEKYREMVEDYNLLDRIEIRNDLSFANGGLFDYLKNNCGLALGVFGESEKAKTVLVNKIVDAAALGLPCLTMKTKATQEFFTENRDIIYSESTPECMAEKILWVLNNQELAWTIGENSIKIYRECFSPEAFRYDLRKVL